MNNILAVLVFPMVAMISMACNDKAPQENAGAEQAYTVLSPEAFRDSISRENVVLVDVRRPDEFSAGHLKNAILVTWGNESEFVSAAQELKGKTLYIYCRSGRRSNAAGLYLSQKLGFKVYDLEGGYLAWTAKDYEIEK